MLKTLRSHRLRRRASIASLAGAVAAQFAVANVYAQSVPVIEAQFEPKTLNMGASDSLPALCSARYKATYVTA